MSPTAGALEEIKAECENLKHLKNILETKLEKAEKEAFDFMKKAKQDLDAKVGELKLLNDVIKKKNIEIGNQSNDINQARKLVKSKEKEIYSLERKVENLSDSLKNVKENNPSWKKENWTNL